MKRIGSRCWNGRSRYITVPGSIRSPQPLIRCVPCMWTACVALSRAQHRGGRGLPLTVSSLCTQWRDLKSHGVGERDTPCRAAILARHRAINTPRWVAQQSQRDRFGVRQGALSFALRPIEGALLVPPSRRPTAPRAQAFSLFTPTQVSPCRSLLDITLVSALLFVHQSCSLLTHSERPRSFLLQPVEIKG